MRKKRYEMTDSSWVFDDLQRAAAARGHSGRTFGAAAGAAVGSFGGVGGAVVGAFVGAIIGEGLDQQ